MSRPAVWFLVIAAIAAAVVGFVVGRRDAPPAPVPPPPPVAEAPSAPAPAAPASEPEIAHPLAAASAPLPALEQSDGPLAEALGALVGRNSVLSLLQTDGFVRRVVATVDALPSSHAAPRVWPVNPTPGRFSVTGPTSDARIAPANPGRYEPFVRMVEAVDAERLVAFYVQFYPLFQQAYVELGYPNRYFNDRLVQVVDHLLATPEPSTPPVLKLTEVKGPVPSTRPWVHYEYADERLESLSAGQKILLRVGLDHERRLKARLADFRRALLAASLR